MGDTVAGASQTLDVRLGLPGHSTSTQQVPTLHPCGSGVVPACCPGERVCASAGLPCSTSGPGGTSEEPAVGSSREALKGQGFVAPGAPRELVRVESGPPPAMIPAQLCQDRAQDSV